MRVLPALIRAGFGKIRLRRRGADEVAYCNESDWVRSLLGIASLSSRRRVTRAGRGKMESPRYGVEY